MPMYNFKKITVVPTAKVRLEYKLFQFSVYFYFYKIAKKHFFNAINV